MINIKAISGKRDISNIKIKREKIFHQELNSNTDYSFEYIK